MDSLPYEEVIIEELNREATQEIKSDNIRTQEAVELEITNDITKDKKPNSFKDSDDEYTGGQITLEL